MNTRYKTVGVMLLVLSIVTACTSPASNPEKTVLALGDALNAGDVDAAMELMADGAVFKMDFYEETLHGANEIRSLFEALVSGHFRIETSTQNIDGEVVTTETKTWGDGIPGGGPNVATELYVIKNGKIDSITWTPTDETVANLTAAMEAMSSEAAPQPDQYAFTVIFDGPECIYEGPEDWPAHQEMTMYLNVEGQDAYEEYGVAVVTLQEGKTFDDLAVWPDPDSPPWMDEIYGMVNEVPQRTIAETLVMTSDATAYIVCFTAYPIAKTDVLGPFEVVQVSD